MKHPVRAVRLAVILALASLFFAPFARAEKLDASQWRFTAVFPCQSQLGSQQVESQIGLLVVTMYSCADAEDSKYFAAVIDYPPGKMPPENHDNAYAGGVDAAAKSAKGTIRRVSPYVLGNTTGREYIIDTPEDNTVLRGRMFLVGDRLYQMVFGGKAGKEDSKECLDFLDSLTLIGTNQMKPGDSTPSE